MTWRLHWLDASGDLRPWQGAITSQVDAARDAMARMVPVQPLDILVQRIPNAVIPEIGMTGVAFRKTLFALTLDPDNVHFQRCLSDGTLARQVAHEAHHCHRMAGPGYGRTLGEALVSEGLAGRFVGRLFGTPPEPWESAVNAEVLATHGPAASALLHRRHDHNSWFYGTSGRYPRWLGYTLGYAIVGDWLAATPDVTGSAWINVPARTVLAAARGQTLPAFPIGTRNRSAPATLSGSR